MSLQVKFPFGRGHGPLHTCGTCGFMTRHRAMFDRHLKRCGGNKAVGKQRNQGPSQDAQLPSPPVCRNYRCEKCGYATSRSKVYLQHRREVHGENFSIYPCDQCEYASRHKSKVIRHRGLVHKSAPEDPDFPQEVDVGDGSQQTETSHASTGLVSLLSGRKIGTAIYQADYETIDNDEDEEDEQNMVPDENQNTPVKKPPKQPENQQDPSDGDAARPAIQNLTFSSPEELERSPNATRIPDPTENAYDYIAGKEKDGDPLSYTCTLCIYSNIHKWKVATHVRSVHMRKTLFKCPYCEFVTERKIEWCVHKTTHTEKMVHACQECSYRTTMKRNFERHQAHHCLGGPFKCSICSYSSSGEAAVQRHMAEYHPSPDKQRAIDTIHNGSGTSGGAGRNTVTSPARVANSATPPRLQANPPPASSSLVIRRRTSNTPRPMSASSATEAQCSICHVWFKNETRLRIHLVSHSNEAPHACPVCDLRYKRPADLNRHMKRKHGAKIEDFKTDSSDPVQDQPLDLCLKRSDEEDMESSDPDQPLDLSMKPPASANNYRPHEMKCSYCSYMAKWPSDLRRHMLVHSIEKRFRCPHCSKRYKYQFDLNMHMRKTHRIHSGKTRVSSSAAFGRVLAPPTSKLAIKQEPADTGYPASSAQEARQHQPKASPQLVATIREKQVPPSHKCPHCEYSGKCRSELERHKLIHTGQKPFLCLFCSYRTSWKGDIKSHLLKQHGTEVEKYGELPELINLCYKPDVNTNLDEDMEQSVDQSDEHEASGSPVPSPASSVTASAGGTSQDTNTNNDLSEYVKDVAGKKMYQCPKCSVNFDFPSKLKNHMEVHENIKKFMCPHCGKRSNWQWDVRKHITSQHPDMSTDVTILSDTDARATLQEYLNKMRQSPPKMVSESKRSSEPREMPELDAIQGLDDYARVMNIDNIEPETSKEVEVYKKPHSLLDSIPGGGFSSLSIGGSNVNSLIATVAAGRYRRFKCNKCGKRSNWKWDIKKHIRQSHPSASMIELTEEEAKETFHEVLQNAPKPKQSNPPPKVGGSLSVKGDPKPAPVLTSKSKYRPFKCTWCGKRSNWKWDLKKHLLGCDRKAKMTILSDEEAKATFDQECSIPPRYKKQLLETTTKVHVPERVSEAPSSPKVKKYKCSLCPYRSDYRSDISRHLKRKHDRRVRGKILVLGSEYAASTLTEYKETWGRKKFVISPEKVQEIEAQQRKTSLEDLDNCIKVVEVDPGSDEDMSDETENHVPEKKHCPNPIASYPKPSPQIRVVSPCTDKQMSYSKVWQCTKCEFRCRNKMTVIAHYRTHGHGQPFKCNICGYSSDYRGSIYRHVKHKHKRRDYQNVITYVALREVEDSCPSRQASPSPKQVATGSVTEGTFIRMFQCQLCTSRTVHKHNLVRHIKEKHPQATDPQKHLLQVEVLSNKSPDHSGKVKVTLAPPNPNVKKLRCSLCPFETIKHGLLKIHQSYHKPKSSESFKCNYCPYYVTTMRRLLKHTRLHLQDESVMNEFEFKDAPQKISLTTPAKSCTSPGGTKTSGKARHYCDKCPYISINKNDFIYHKQFHRPKPTAPYKCDICPYWVSLRRLLTQHQKVHSAEYKLQYYPKETTPQNAVMTLTAGTSQRIHPSPAKSEASHLSLESNDMVEVAGLKQQIISSRVTSVPISPVKLTKPDLMDKADDNLMEGYVIDSSGHIINNKSYKKIHQCRYCPYKNVRSTNLRLHEKMHERVKKSKELYKCHYCNYSVGNKGLLAHHTIVHSSQYQPGVDNINDVEAMDENGEFREDKTEAEDDKKEEEEEDEEENNNVAAHVFPERATFKTNPANKLEVGDLPNKAEYYIKMDDSSGQPVLEKATLKKWCCDRCPYATMKKFQFEKHLMLHGSKQKYPCEYCDYSVPGYHLLLQHKKLHLMPNANLLSVQSISNLQRLPEVPADIAVAVDQPNPDDNLKHGIHDNIPFYENSSSFVEPKKLYRCDRCPYTNIRRDHLLSHLKFHMINSDLRCPYCDYSVSKVHLLNQHIRVHFSTPGSEMSSEPQEENIEPPDFFAALKLKQNVTDKNNTDKIKESTLKVKDNADKVKESTLKVKDNADKVKESTFKVKDNADKVKDDTDTVTGSNVSHPVATTMLAKDPRERSPPLQIPVYQTPAQEEPMSLVTKPLVVESKPDNVQQNTSKGTDELPEDLSLPKDLSRHSGLGACGSGGGACGSAAATEPPAKSSCRYCDRKFGSLEKKNLHERHHLVGSC